jgi:hypothetical protein
VEQIPEHDRWGARKLRPPGGIQESSRKSRSKIIARTKQTSTQVVQQRAAQLELEDQRRQVQELSKAKKQFENEVSELRDRLELEVIAKNEEASELPHCSTRIGNSSSMTPFKVPSVNFTPGCKTWKFLPLRLRPFIPVF